MIDTLSGTFLCLLAHSLVIFSVLFDKVRLLKELRWLWVSGGSSCGFSSVFSQRSVRGSPSSVYSTPYTSVMSQSLRIPLHAHQDPFPGLSPVLHVLSYPFLLFSIEIHHRWPSCRPLLDPHGIPIRPLLRSMRFHRRCSHNKDETNVITTCIHSPIDQTDDTK